VEAGRDFTQDILKMWAIIERGRAGKATAACHAGEGLLESQNSVRTLPNFDVVVRHLYI
jgi:hypothetical protein